MKYIAGFILFLVFISSLTYGGWRLSRWFNWSFTYKSNVEETVRDMVKEECLKR